MEERSLATASRLVVASKRDPDRIAAALGMTPQGEWTDVPRSFAGRNTLRYQQLGDA